MGKAETATFKIESVVISETTKCEEGYSCLKGESRCLCPVEDDLGGKVIFVSEGEKKSCPYKMSYGYSYVCSCPTRKEIFIRYRR